MAEINAVSSELLVDESFFLSAVNPTATVEQRDLEALALELLESPKIVEAREIAGERFETLVGSAIPAEAAGIEAQMQEWAYHYLLLALNSDPNYPKVLGGVLGPPHAWFGMTVPGTRGPGTGENVDNHYSLIPIDPYSRFALHGKVQAPPIGDCPMYVTAALSQSGNVSGLDWREIRFEDDGTFLVTIDPEPANGRPNHLRTAIDARWVFIRDGRKHWDQRPNAYRITRLDAPTGPPLALEQLRGVAARYIVEDVAQNFWYRQMCAYLEPNTMTEVQSSGIVGGMPSQALLRGRIRIADDQAFVLTIGPGGSDYWVLVAYSWWFMSGDFGHRTSSLNNSQSVANPDGSYTYVFSIADPGVHNWIDTEGRHESLFMNRWQLLPASGAQAPSARAELVKLAELGQVLPEETQWVTSHERAQQLDERRHAFERRYAV